jgi:hypothetical protein
MKKTETRTENSKRVYIAPSIERFPLEAEGILAGSVTVNAQTSGKHTIEGLSFDGGGPSAAAPRSFVRSSDDESILGGE